MNKLKIGDVVAFNCGSPSMVVIGIYASGCAEVVWIDSNDVLQKANLPIQCFFLVEQLGGAS